MFSGYALALYTMILCAQVRLPLFSDIFYLIFRTIYELDIPIIPILELRISRLNDLYKVVTFNLGYKLDFLKECCAVLRVVLT